MVKPYESNRFFNICLRILTVTPLVRRKTERRSRNAVNHTASSLIIKGAANEKYYLTMKQKILPFYDFKRIFAIFLRRRHNFIKSGFILTQDFQTRSDNFRIVESPAAPLYFI